MEPEAAQYLMKIQSAVQGELTIKSVKRGDQCTTFKTLLNDYSHSWETRRFVGVINNSDFAYQTTKIDAGSNPV